MNYLEDDTTKGTEDRLRILLTESLLASPIVSEVRASAVAEGFRAEQKTAWLNYAERGLGNLDGMEEIIEEIRGKVYVRRTHRVVPVNFVKHLIRNFPHSLYEWIRLNTGWLRDVVVEPEPSDQELAELAASDPSEAPRGNTQGRTIRPYHKHPRKGL